MRRKLYTSSLERWKAYAGFLPALLRPLREQILEYERGGGLPSSADLLRQVGRLVLNPSICRGGLPSSADLLRQVSRGWY